MTRQEAKRLGLKTYFSGTPCKHGHIAERYVKNWTCVTCALDRMTTPQAKANAKKWRANNVEYRRQRDKDYVAVNKAKIAKRMREWRAKRKPLNNAVARAWSAKNAEKRKVFSRKWRAQNAAIMLAHKAKRRAALLCRTPKWLSSDDLWMIAEAHELAVHRSKLFGFAWHVDHVVPLQGRTVSGLHIPQNLQVIPRSDNIRKGNKFLV